MKVLHTSDWHLGRTLYGRKRTSEYARFLSWLADTIVEQDIDLLCIAGDVFDTTTPSNRSQNLYYNFLQKIVAAGCREVVIIAGNHDSPTLLEAPGKILKSLHVHVVGRIDSNPGKEIIVIKNADKSPGLMVCAVPYLRDRDIRTATAGESIDDKGRNLVKGVEHHYHQVVKLAEQQRESMGITVPIIAMGHLFAAGGKTVEGDGVRDLYVGTLAHIPAHIFSDSIDYLALGHLHSSQIIGGMPTRRYSGSPLPMSFAEANKEKEVLIISISDTVEEIRPLTVPSFQNLVSLRGDLPSMLEKIHSLKAEQFAGWLEIICECRENPATLQESLQKAVEGTSLEIIRIVNTPIVSASLMQGAFTQSLEELTVDDVFDECLKHHGIDDTEKEALTMRFRKACIFLQEYDSNAD
ncbi:MAG: exonuclease SbcCD subunit D C-terminal domain-containing protein [Desulforhopalus sp.]